MLRYILRIITAVLAFMIGLGWVQLVKLSGAPAETKTVTAPPMVAVSPTVTPTPTPSSAPKLEQKVRYVCRDRLFSFVLDHLRKENKEDYVDGFIEGAGISNCAELFQVEKRTDLNGDGRKESILRTKNTAKGNFYCGGMGNCPFWVIEPHKKGYKIILDEPVTEKVLIQRERTRGYNDLVTRYNGGMMYHTMAYYSYRGGKYRLRKCVNETMDIYGKKYISAKKLSWCG
jgi:hypothetical protein